MEVCGASDRDVRHTRPMRRHQQQWMKYSAVIAIGLIASAFVTYSHYQIASLEKKLAMTNLAWKRRSSELESRVKREAANQKMREKTIHEIVKRDAEVKDPPPPEPMVTPSSGSAYTRWGRTDCPYSNEDTFRVYHGTAAGSYHTHTGGGGNYLCLHTNITYAPKRFVEGNQGVSYIYGVEWRDGTWMYELFDMQDIKTKGVQYHSLPCAVCIARGRFAQIMIPGREECPYGFVTEYKGYIMGGGHSDKHASEYICVDERPQVVPGTEGNQQGSSINVVETQCASLPCEPVVAGREVRCVVCSI